jgi:hypothetical protein
LTKLVPFGVTENFIVASFSQENNPNPETREDPCFQEPMVYEKWSQFLSVSSLQPILARVTGLAGMAGVHPVSAPESTATAEIAVIVFRPNDFI